MLVAGAGGRLQVAGEAIRAAIAISAPTNGWQIWSTRKVHKQCAKGRASWGLTSLIKSYTRTPDGQDANTHNCKDVCICMNCRGHGSV